MDFWVNSLFGKQDSVALEDSTPGEPEDDSEEISTEIIEIDIDDTDKITDRIIYISD